VAIEYSVHAPIGFDERPVLHCIRSVHEAGGRVTRVRLYQPETGDRQGEARSREAVETLRDIMRALGAEVEVTRVEITPIIKPIIRAYKLLYRDLGHPGLHIAACLSSGMRPLVIALYTALLSLPQEVQKRVRICIEPEGMPEKRFFIPLTHLTTLQRLLRDEHVADVLEAIVSAGGATFAELYKKITSVDSPARNISRSKLYRMLQKLVEEGILVKSEEGGVYKLAERY